MSDSDIEKMINEAEQNAEADKERREMVETRNQAEQLIHSTEKMLTDFGEKIDPSEKSEIENSSRTLKLLYLAMMLRKLNRQWRRCNRVL